MLYISINLLRFVSKMLNISSEFLTNKISYVYEHYNAKPFNNINKGFKYRKY